MKNPNYSRMIGKHQGGVSALTLTSFATGLITDVLSWRAYKQTKIIASFKTQNKVNVDAQNPRSSHDKRS